jgi:hypothetical protein
MAKETLEQKPATPSFADRLDLALEASRETATNLDEAFGANNALVACNAGPQKTTAPTAEARARVTAYICDLLM